MTLSNAITRCTEALGDTAGSDDIIMWLNELEATIISELYQTHNIPAAKRCSLNTDTPKDTVLLIPDPYSEVYIAHAMMKNDLKLRDMRKYASSAVVFAAAYSSFADWFNRTYLPRTTGIKL